MARLPSEAEAPVRLHFDGAGVAPDEVVVLLPLGGDGTGSLVRTVQSTGGPQHDQVLAFVLLDAQDRKIGRLDQVAVAQQFPLDRVELVVVQADWREDGLAVFVAILSDDNLTPAQVLEVVGESTEGAHHGVRVPARLVLDSVPHDGSLPDQVVQIKEELAAHGMSPDGDRQRKNGPAFRLWRAVS